jgi:hypothetical protein
LEIRREDALRDAGQRIARLSGKRQRLAFLPLTREIEG